MTAPFSFNLDIIYGGNHSLPPVGQKHLITLIVENFLLRTLTIYLHLIYFWVNYSVYLLKGHFMIADLRFLGGKVDLMTS